MKNKIDPKPALNLHKAFESQNMSNLEHKTLESKHENYSVGDIN